MPFDLEHIKLLISMLTPLLVLVLGIVINHSIKTSERSVGLRSEIYRQIGGDLNDIYAYLAFLGGWKEMTPADVIRRKRAVDKSMYTYKPFFSAELFATYERFMREAFKPFGQPGRDACIRSALETGDGDRRVHGAVPWNPAWDACFTGEDNMAQQSAAYERFLEQLARDLKL